MDDFYDKLIKAIIIVLIWILGAILVMMGTVLVMGVRGSMSNDKTTVELSQYDVGMLFGVLLLARRHGDTQTFDWAGDFRNRLVAPDSLDPGETKTDG